MSTGTQTTTPPSSSLALGTIIDMGGEFSGVQSLLFDDSEGSSSRLINNHGKTVGLRRHGMREAVVLDKKQVEALINHLQAWLKTGSLEVKG